MVNQVAFPHEMPKEMSSREGRGYTQKYNATRNAVESK
jgi:hypothetical protein